MEQISEVSARLSELSKQREALANYLRELDKSGKVKLKFKILEKNLDGLKACGVDGGLLKKECHGVGIVLRRAVAVCFEYKNGKLENTGYFPSKVPIPDAAVTGPELSENDFNLFANLKREEIELKTCLESIEKFSPDILIRDGSIVLYPSNIPEKDSATYAAYKNVLRLYKELYKTCEEKGILLCGAVEDSRGKRYCTILQNEVIPKVLQNAPAEVSAKIFAAKDVLASTTDTLFLYYLLDVGERTAHTDYSATSELPILKDLEEYARKVFVQYIKAAEFDRPLRVDFLSAPEHAEETASKISEIIYAVSKQNRLYSFPNVLIEADARAKLPEIEMARFVSAISDKLGRNPALFELRRELRPF